MSLDNAELRELSAIVGAPVIAAEPYGWGFENRAAIATLEDRRRLLIERSNVQTFERSNVEMVRYH